MANSVSSVNGAFSSTALDGSTDTSVLPSKLLSQQDFLKLLVAQMTSQDPLNPQSNTDFAAQMAQFSALQTAQQTQTQVTELNSQQQVLQANDLIGRAVTLLGSDSSVASGTVSGVQMSSGTPMLVVNGISYDLSQVLSIQPATTQ